MSGPWKSFVVGWVATAVLQGLAAQAGCAPQWLGMGGRNGADLSIFASTAWDPDGSGPEASRLVVVGSFSSIADVRAQSVAVRHPTTGAWSALPGLGYADGLAVLGRGNGELWVGGYVQGMGNLARWNGAQWQSLGSGLNGLVYALAELPNGDVVAGGLFTTAGGSPAGKIARWDGSQWHALGAGCNGAVHSFAVLPNGDLVAGGTFTMADGQPAPGIALWNGSAWSQIGNPGVNVMALRTLPGGELLAGGYLGAAGAVARWNGSWWTTEAAADGSVLSLLTTGSGDWFAGGAFNTLGGVSAARIAKRGNGVWSGLGSGLGGNPAIAYGLVELAGGAVAVAGRFGTVGGVSADNVAIWNGAWEGIAEGLDGDVSATAVAANGDRYVGGYFRFAGMRAVNGVARWDGTAWQSLGTGASNGLNGGCSALLALPNGDLVVAGSPQALPGTYVSIWRNGSWVPMGSGIPGEVRCLARLPNGDVLAGGWFNWAGGGPCQRIARWDGTQWSPMGAGFDFAVHAILVTADGGVIAGGELQNSGAVPTSRVARWDGAAWQPMGSGPGTIVRALAQLPDGTIVAGGDFVSGSVRTLQYWNGTGWAVLGGGANQTVLSLAAHPSGLLFAGGYFSAIGGVPTNLGVWNGTAWSAVAAAPIGNVRALAPAGAAEVFVGGRFSFVAAGVSRNATTMQLPCAPNVTSLPTACVGPAGPLTAAVVAPPMRGATYRSVGRGFAAAGVAVHVIGLAAANTPLANLHGSGLPNCELRTSLDAVALALPIAGATTFAVSIPGDPALVGVAVREQYLQLAPDASGALTMSGSNALAVTVGSF